MDVEGRGMRRGGRVRVSIDTRKLGGPSLAKQQFRDECDINMLMKKYEKTGVIAHLNRHQGQYADVTGLVDFHEASNIVLRAQETFMSLPATIRARFHNDPGEFLDFATDPKNGDDMVKMGLATAKPAEPKATRDAPAEPPGTAPKAPKPDKGEK